MLFVWMVVIFMFSAENGSESSQTSSDITNDIIHVIIPTYPNLDPSEQTSIFNELSHLVRKFAHFFNFLILALISSSLIKSYNIKKKTAIMVCLLFCLLYAISDELHQLFVPKRGANFFDVLIDFSGSCLGVLIFYLVSYLTKKEPPSIYKLDCIFLKR